MNEETGRLQIVELPDLDTGLEIKNVQSAKSENTISKHIGKEKRNRDTGKSLSTSARTQTSPTKKPGE